MNEQNSNTQPRIFKIGTMTIVEDESIASLSVEQVRTMLKSSYPELANVSAPTITTTDEGVQVIEWKPQPRRKG